MTTEQIETETTAIMRELNPQDLQILHEMALARNRDDYPSTVWTARRVLRAIVARCYETIDKMGSAT